MKFQIKLGFRDLKNSDAVIQGNLYAAGVVNNAYFPEAEIIAQGVVVGTASANLKTALEKPKSSTRTALINDAREKWELEVTSLTKLEEIAVNKADATDEVKIAMIQSANREAVEYPVHQKYTFTAKRGPKTREVVFTGDTKDAVAHAYTWTTDLDNFTNKADPVLSAAAKVTATNVPLGDLAFFHKGIYANKSMDWEGPIFLTVL